AAHRRRRRGRRRGARESASCARFTGPPSPRQEFRPVRGDEPPTSCYGAAMQIRPLVAVALAAAVVCVRPAHAGDATGALAPYEDVLEVLADLTWHAHDDTYRFPPPKDPTGHDLYQLCLQRLENWEQRYPGRLRDVTTYGRAEALEHLGEYKTATDLYRQVAAQSS